MSKNLSESSAYRVLDAAINRASEGFRVVEDLMRMQLENSHLAKSLKQLRHDLAKSTAPIDFANRIAARDSEGDVGRSIQTESEYTRASQLELVRANLSRAQQALRTIEEFSKSIPKCDPQPLEQLRYQAYTIEKAILTTLLSAKSISESAICVLITGQSSTTEFSSLVSKLIEAKAEFIQLRDKALTDRELVERGRLLSDLTSETPTRWIMNDRADLAVASHADGVHVGQDDMQVANVRAIVGANKLIGVSTHSIEQARQAALDGASYIGVGPVFESQTKSFNEFVGVELVKEVANEIELPAFAIGGINAGNVSHVYNSGISRLAVSRAIANASCPKIAIKDLRDQLNRETDQQAASG